MSSDDDESRSSIIVELLLRDPEFCDENLSNARGYFACLSKEDQEAVLDSFKCVFDLGHSSGEDYYEKVFEDFLSRLQQEPPPLGEDVFHDVLSGSNQQQQQQQHWNQQQLQPSEILQDQQPSAAALGRRPSLPFVPPEQQWRVPPTRDGMGGFAVGSVVGVGDIGGVGSFGGLAGAAMGTGAFGSAAGMKQQPLPGEYHTPAKLRADETEHGAMDHRRDHDHRKLLARIARVWAPILTEEEIEAFLVFITERDLQASLWSTFSNLPSADNTRVEDSLADDAPPAAMPNDTDDTDHTGDTDGTGGTDHTDHNGPVYDPTITK